MSQFKSKVSVISALAIAERGAKVELPPFEDERSKVEAIERIMSFEAEKRLTNYYVVEFPSGGRLMFPLSAADQPWQSSD